MFLFLKLKYILHGKDNEMYVPQNVFDIFNDVNKNLTFLNISGLNEKSFELNSLNNDSMIFIPENIIKNFFSWNKTNCREENKHVENKLDLYISLLTYIYYHNFPAKGNRENFHTHMTNFLVKSIANEEEEEKMKKNINLLYNSVIYDFLEIPNEIEKFIYKFTDIKINSFHFFKQYNVNNDNNNNRNLSSDNDNYTNFVFHHIITMFRFYNQYILPYFFTNPTHYRYHPLHNVCKKIKMNK